MSIARLRFAPPVAIRGTREQTKLVRPYGGLHAGVPPGDLPPGFSPALRNFVPSPDGYIEPRSGLSSYGTHDFGGAVLGAVEVFDVEGRSCGFAPSAVSLSFLHPTNEAWSHLSYVASALTHMQGDLSGTSSEYFRTAAIFDQNIEEFIAVTSNNTDSLKFFVVDAATTTFSDFTFVDSIASTRAAKDVVSVNDRLVLFNTLDADGVRKPTRVMWSSRGNPRSFLIADEAGAEDLMDMKGEGQAAVRFRDFLILFTEYEIWRATPTLDAYAFRFDRVVDGIGCRFAKTIVATPDGVIFLGRDREVYVTDGASVAPLGAIGGEGSSRVERLLDDEAINLDRAWGIYNQSENRYELYYAANDTTEGFPTRALYYSLTHRTWWPQRFPLELSSGADISDAADATTWDSLEGTWDELGVAWDAFAAAPGSRRANVFTSAGSTFRFLATAGTDDGEAIDARWASGGLGASGIRQAHLTEIWTDYEADSASVASLYVGDARNRNDLEAVREITLTPPGNVVYTPTWKTGRDPTIEIRIADGSRPRIVSFQATLRDASKF